MNSRRRLIYYILVNICVSALVTGTVLFIYDRLYRKDCSAPLPGSTDGTPSSAEMNVSIVGINGTGTLENETVIIQNDGNSPLVLTGWTLKNNQGSTYTFPQLTLYPGGKVQLHTNLAVILLLTFTGSTPPRPGLPVNWQPFMMNKTSHVPSTVYPDLWTDIHSCTIVLFES